MKSAIILAAGQSVRFNGLLKEFLPTGEDREVIDHSISAAKQWGADRIIITTNPNKIAQHAKHFSKPKYQDLNISFKVLYEGEMLDSLLLACQEATSENLMLMADTVFSGSIELPDYYDLAFGTFNTNTPDRYSIFDGGRIITKPKGYTGDYKAWGCVAFSDEVAEYWQSYMFNHYDAAFNSAISEFGYDTFDIGTYSDLGTFSRYLDYLKGIDIEGS
jgi:dTDP-glucose pyrophosphorylase